MDDDQQTYEDLLVQLYTHDNTIEEQYELGTDDPQYDEDHALEAYESILQTCNRFPPEQEKNESTLKTVLRTLTARFLAQHFYKFPHVQQHVMDALVAMCSTEHVVAVRMQSLQSLWWILKTAVRGRDALSSLARQRIQACVDMILDGKKEGERDEEDEEETQKQRTRRLMERVAKQVQVTLDKAAQGSEGGGEGERENKSISPPRRPKMQQHPSSRPSPYARDERMSRSRSQTPSPHRSSRRPERRPSPDQPMRSTRRDERKPTHHHRRSSSPRPPSRSSHHSTHAPPIPVPLNPKHCPPGPHLFIGGVPKDAIPSDFVSFLAPVDPDLTPNSIIIKMPSQSLPAGYAFVNMTSTSNAIDAIHYVKTTPYKTGRPLICDFARGPPTPIVRFIERQNLANPSLHGHDATHLVNFDEKPPFVWKQLIRELDKIGHVDEVDAEERRHGGLVKFEDVECAKALIRRHHLIVEGYEVMPIYYMKGGVTIGAHISYTNDPKPLPREGGGGKPHFSHRSSYREESSSSRKHYPPPSSSSHRYEASRYEPERGRHSSRSPSRDGGRPSRSSRDDRSIAEIARTSRFSGTRPTHSSRSPSPTSSRRPSSSGRGPTSSYEGHRTSHRSTTQSSSSSRYKKRSRSFDEEQNHHYSQRSRVERGGGNGSNGMYKRREKSFEDNVDELMVDYDEEE